MAKRNIVKIIKVAPLQEPEIIECDGSFKGIQELVGDLLGFIDPWADPVSIICDDSGKIKGLTANRVLFNADGTIRDLIAGTFYICGTNDAGDIISVPNELMDKYMKLFEHPEIFTTENGVLCINRVVK